MSKCRYSSPLFFIKFSSYYYSFSFVCICSVEFKLLNIIRRGSRINIDRFPKRAPKAQAFSGVRGLALPRNYLDFYSLKSPFLGFRVIQVGYWPDFNLESVNMKNVTDFRKTVKTGVDPHLIIVCTKLRVQLRERFSTLAQLLSKIM